MQDFLSLGTHPRYLEGDIPYRRGYLLHGPPGTGKTSAVLALASHFGLDVYKLNLAGSVDDKKHSHFVQASTPVFL
ncbi:hypothetical protein EJ05DRAFT_384565 [Pseudovirgaria hyperparasitica]|uniref:ATPase AAA-type core domain-containing protein n=1 Tax=Pseudovirgaria hyperparasitica TaxID=470096 RepID=A0A6A6VQA9_9PEZI|nr:uncharacterized protein EJ05DRAFT_384565 [Pseudovirgaria hyperparasitica]KAF2752383.1 hypothetical protein EJ05DRAFT_384565 [Pseudovirgaria hyperparasitica]